MKMLTTGEVSYRLAVTPSTVRVWCQRGLFPNAYMAGRDWLIPETDLDNFKRPKKGRKKEGKDGKS